MRTLISSCPVKNKDQHLTLILRILVFHDSNCDTGILEKQGILFPICSSMHTLLFQNLGLSYRQSLEGSSVDTKEKVNMINLHET